METKVLSEKTITLTENQLVSIEFAAFKSGVSTGKKIVDAAVAEARRMQMKKKPTVEQKPISLPTPPAPSPTPDPKKAA